MPTTSTPSRQARPATAPSIARRWSPCGVDPAAAQAAGAAHGEAVGGRLDVGAEPAQAVDDGGDPVGLLTRSSSAPRDDRLALGEAAEQRDQRQLVDRQRHLVGLDARAAQRAVRDVELARPARVGARRRRAASSSPTQRPRPSAARIRRKPTRVQLAAMPRDREPRARDEHARRRRGRRPTRGRRGRRSRPARARRRRPTVTRSPSRRDAGAGARRASARCGRGSARARPRSSRRRRAGPRAARSDLTCALSDGQLVLDPAQRRGRAIVERRKRPVARLERGAHLPQRLGDRGRPAGGGSTRRRRASSGRPRAARRASPAAGASACRRCRRRSRRPGSCAPRRPGAADRRSSSARSSTRAPSARTAASVECVSSASR